MTLSPIVSGVEADCVNEKSVLGCSVFVLVGVCILMLGWHQGTILEVGAQAADEPALHERTVRYSFVLSNGTNQTVNNVTFSAFAPTRETPFQNVQSITATSPFELKVDDYGNQRLDFNLSKIAPYGDRTITVTARVRMQAASSSRLPVFRDKVPDQWRTSALDPNHPKVSEALQSIGPIEDQHSAVSWLGQATTWVSANIDDVGYVSRDLGAHYALTERRGDCTEFMHALVELARLSDLRAVAVAGFRTNAMGQILEASDYHNWALVYSGKDWFVSDPHADIFAAEQDQYIVFNLLHSNSTHANSQRFFSHDSRITAAMR